MNKIHYLILGALLIASAILYVIVKKYELKPLYIIFIGAGLAIVGAVFTAWGTFAQNERSSKSTEEIKETGNKNLANTAAQLIEIEHLKKQNDTLKADLIIRDTKINNQNEKIIGLSNSLVEKSEYISNHITGKGYPLVVPTALRASSPSVDETITFTLFNESDMPLYDIEVCIIDWNHMSSKFSPSDNPKSPYIKQIDFKKSILQITTQTQMFPGTNILNKDKFDLRDGLLYIILKCRSSFLHEKVAFVTKNRAIYQKFIVYDGKGTIIQQWTSPTTPKDVLKALDEKLSKIPNKVNFTMTD